MPMVYFKENSNFPRFHRGFNIFSRGGGGGGVQLFLGVSNCLFLMDSHITCVFPGGPGRLPPPKDQRKQYLDQLDDVTKVRYEKKLSILTPPPRPDIPKCIHCVWKNNHSGLSRIQIVFPGSDNLEGQGVRTPLKNNKNIEFPSNTGPLTNHKATKSAFNVGPSQASQRNAI